MSDAARYRVNFRDGTSKEVTFDPLPMLVADMEDEFGQPAFPLIGEGFAKAIFFGIWWMIHEAQETPFGFREWLGLTASFEVVDVPAKKSGGKPDPKREPASGSS